MANNIAFQAMGKTYQANATTTSQRIQILSDVYCRNLLVASHESSTTGKPVYFNIGDSTVTCVLPAPGSPSNCLIAVPGQNKVFTVAKQFAPSSSLYIAFITESGTGECYFTPGEGL
jgi:hypothetical protein